VGAGLPNPVPADRFALTINKLESSIIGNVGNGLPLAAPGLPNDAIRGVEFTVLRHPTIDLTAVAGWEAAQDLSVAGFRALFPADLSTLSAGSNVHRATTNNDGQINLTGLPMGLYLVVETSVANAQMHIDGAWESVEVLAAAPFVVALPMTHPVERDRWMDHVHVYPKNAIVDFEKTVADAATVSVGDNVVWTIRADVPNHADEYLIDFFRIVDVLDTRLAPVTSGVGAPVLSLWHPEAAVRAGLPALTAGTHFTVDWNATSREWTFDFTVAGRAVLDGLVYGSQVQVVLTTTVISVGDGTIINDARFYPSRRHYVEERPLEDETQTRFGGILVEKIERGTTPPVVLAGAVFQVFASLADARAQVNPVNVCPAAGDPVVRPTGEGCTFWTTNAQGRVVINGLRVSNFENGQPITNTADHRQYWLVEIEAPAGYELLAEPVPFTVTTPGTVTLGGSVNLTVENIPHNAGFRLPMTGGMGTTIITYAGILVLGVAAVWVLTARRKAEHS